MTDADLPLGRGRVPEAALVPFFFLTFGIAWGIFALFFAFPDELTAIFGPPSGSHPLFMLAVYAPAISALTLVVRHTGLAGMRRYLSRLLLARMPLVWWLVLLFGLPIPFILGAAVQGYLWPFPAYPYATAGELIAALSFTAVLGPIEEFGWRGLALPLLQRRMAPVWAGLLVGALWGGWHLPAFFLSGTPQSAWVFMPFFVGSVAVSLILTPMFNAARGSILIPMLFHFQLNNPIWPYGQPWDMWFFAAAAVLTVWLCRGKMFRRDGAATEVVPGGSLRATG